MAKDTNDEGAVCTKCGTVVDNAQDWDTYHRHGAK